MSAPQTIKTLRRWARTAELYGLWIPRMPLDARRCRGYEFGEGWRRVYLHHVRKTGGTSLANSFLALGG